MSSRLSPLKFLKNPWSICGVCKVTDYGLILSLVPFGLTEICPNLANTLKGSNYGLSFVGALLLPLSYISSIIYTYNNFAIKSKSLFKLYSNYTQNILKPYLYYSHFNKEHESHCLFLPYHTHL